MAHSESNPNDDGGDGDDDDDQIVTYYGSYVPGGPTTPSESELLERSRSVDISLRASLGDYPHPLPDDIFLRMLGDVHPAVVWAAASHWHATTEQIERAIKLRPILLDLFVGNDNAPIWVLDDRPVFQRDGPFRRRYLAGKHATAQQAGEFLRECAEQSEDEDVTLGDIWRWVAN